MGIFKDMVSGIKQIIVSDEDDNLFDQQDSIFEQQEKKPILPGLKPKTSKPSGQTLGLNFDLNNYDINAAKTSGKKMSNKGHIQVYVPKTFEESFDIINVVKDGITVLVNVEVCNPQVSQRIVDVLTGALVALGGQCKKMGEKQYIFSLNAEMTGAMDYVPSSGQGQYQNGYNYPFQNPFNPMQNPFGQNPMYQNDMGQNNQGFNQPQQNNNFNQNPYNNFNNQPNNRPNDRNTFNPNDYYNPPVSQF